MTDAAAKPAMSFFERYLTLWVAASIVVGVLIEVPVMLSLVAIVNRSKTWYEKSPAVRKLAARSEQLADAA